MAMNAGQQGGRTEWRPFEFVIKSQNVALEQLSPAVAQAMQKAWGDNWLFRLNQMLEAADKRKRERDPRHPIRKPINNSGDLPDWDLGVLCGVIEDVANDVDPYRSDSKAIRNAAWTVRKIRNKHAHYNLKKIANELETAQENIDKVSTLVEMVAGAESAQPIVQIKQEMINWVDRRVDQASQASELSSDDVAQIKALLLELKSGRMVEAGKGSISENGSAVSDQTKTVSEPAASASATPGTMSAAVLPSGNSIVRRRNAIPPHRAGLVLFPTVDEPLRELAYVECTAHKPGERTGSLFMPLIEDRFQANLCYSIVQNARWGEVDVDRSTMTVRGRFDPNVFQGPSFGLATAIADRGARYGYSDQFSSTYIIATGEIVKGGQGEVGPIDFFDAKVQLLEREAPAGALFIFPAANLANASAETVEALKRSTGRGSLTWRAISHLREVEDLYPAPVVQAASPQPNAADSEAGSALVVGTVPPSLSAALPARAVWKRAVGLSVGTGLAVIVGIYALSEIRGALRGDPVAEAASQEKVDSFRRLAAAIGSVPARAEDCRALLDATATYSKAERRNLGESWPTDFAALERCTTIMQLSDKRWAALASADKAKAARAEGAEDAVFAARADLTVFDLSRSHEPDKAALLTRTQEVGELIAASDARLAKLEAAASKVHDSRGPESDRDLVDIATSLTDLDRRRMSAVQTAESGIARDAASRLAASELRLNLAKTAYEKLLASNDKRNRQTLQSALAAVTDYDRLNFDAGRNPVLGAALSDGSSLIVAGAMQDLEKSVEAYRARPSGETQRSMAEAATALSVADRKLLSPAQLSLFDTVRQGETDILASDQKLRGLLAADRELEGARALGKGMADAAEKLISALDELDDFDRSRLEARHRLAVGAAESIRAQMAGSSDRIAAVLRSAEIVLLAGEAATETMRTRLSHDYGVLSQIDLERLSDQDSEFINRACMLGPAEPKITGQTRTALRPGAWNSCVGPVITFGPPILKPSLPNR